MEEKKPKGRPKGTPKKKLNSVEKMELIKKSVSKILKEHLSYNDYVKWVIKEYDLSWGQANNYWIESWDDVRQKFQLDKDKLINKHLAHYWMLYDQALSVGDLSNARQVLNDISKLLALAEPEKLDVKQELKIKFNFGTPNEAE